MDTRHRFVTLDGLRGVAAMAVIYNHYRFESGDHSFHGMSYLAVDFFFVLSGFVIASAYDERLRADLRPLEFLKIRLIRLYPLYFLAMLLFIPEFLTGYLRFTASGLAKFGVQMFMLPIPGKRGDMLYPFIGISWTLLFELIANFAYAACARHLRMSTLLNIVGLGAVGVVASSFWYGNLNVGAYWLEFPGALVRVTFGFFAGVAIWHFRPRIATPAVPSLVFVVGLSGLLFLPLAGIVPAHLFELVCIFAVFPMIVLLGSSASLAKFEEPLFRLFGDVSYGVYILHWSVRLLFGLLGVVVLHRDLLAAPAAVPALMAFTVIAAILSYRLFDLPARRWLLSRLYPIDQFRKTQFKTS